MNITRYRPNHWLNDIEKELLPFIYPWVGQSEGTPSLQSWVPKVDVKEDKDKYTVFVDVPGVDTDDIDIEMDGHTLTIRGERKIEKEEKSDDYFRMERSVGKFCRQFVLPDTIDSDKIQAQTKKGVLTITLPKIIEQKLKKIQIKGN